MTSSEPIERTFAILEAAAAAGERCPLARERSVNGIDSTYVTALARAGRIFVEISSRNWRRVTILTGAHKGKSTAPNPDPHARVYQTVGAEGRKINNKLTDPGANKRKQPSAPRLLSNKELFR